MRRFARSFIVLACIAVPTLARAQELPIKRAGKPTTRDITAADLMTRLYEFADDSMMGRQGGTIYNIKGTDYIARSLKALGLEPAGENGTYFQDVPFVMPLLDRASTIAVDGKQLKAGEDFIGVGVENPRPVTGAGVIFGGMALDTTNTLDPAVARGKVVVLLPNPAPITNFQAFAATAGYRRYVASLADAAALAVVRGEKLTPGDIRAAFDPPPGQARLRADNPPAARTTLVITSAAAEALLGAPIAQVTKGTAGRSAQFNVSYVNTARPSRNVLAVLRGSDPKLRNQYVGIGAHNDHVGFNNIAQDHDSLRAFNSVVRRGGAEEQRREPTAAEWAQIRALTDTLHSRHGGPRSDSIFNGADDDGSGSMGVLEIAETFAKSSKKPKRSILFVWHTGEEFGMFGSKYLMEHPAVARDSIVADLNVDMIGRGSADDVANGGPAYLELIGSRRLSTEYGNLVEQVNQDTKAGFVFNYQFDADGEPHQFYCRSDHWEYGRFGIPVTFFTTGGHRDYHMKTDEAQYINYDKYARVSQLIHDVAERVANLDHKLVVDKPKPDPNAPCVQ
jgi:hypothetical protein